MADSTRLAHTVDFTRKQTGKSPKSKSHMKRSQSHFDAKELSKNGYSSTLSVNIVCLYSFSNNVTLISSLLSVVGR